MLYKQVPTFNNLSGDVDFKDDTVSVQFNALTNVARFNVPIYNDDLVECPETFYLNLSIPSEAKRMGVIKAAQSSATVTITDTVGECYSNTLCSIQHSQHTF